MRDVDEENDFRLTDFKMQWNKIVSELQENLKSTIHQKARKAFYLLDGKSSKEKRKKK